VITVVLRKDSERDFRILDSCRPVALLNTLGKLLESIVATRLSYMIEGHGLLPKSHFGGRKGISIDHVIQHLLGTGRGRKASILLLDVSGAYDNRTPAFDP
jgi:Reverse transcriptase (RNA-dependent DNA polymerase)